MEMTASYRKRITGLNDVFRPTLDLYRKAVMFFVEVCDSNWDDLRKNGDSAHDILKGVETLTISTKSHPRPNLQLDLYDRSFAMFPSYLRRSAISAAIGMVAGYRSGVELWKAGKLNGEPRLPKRAPSVYPVLYKGGNFVSIDGTAAKIKCFVRNEWNWVPIRFRKGDADYISHHLSGAESLSPSLVKKGKVWSLTFAYAKKAIFQESKADRVLAVDLGVNSACACSVMDESGAVVARRCLSLASEEDRLLHALGRIRKAQQGGSPRTPRLWARANGINADISSKTASFIAKMASEYSVGCIAMEALDFGGSKAKGKTKRQRLHLWERRKVQSIVETKAHSEGIRISRVCACNTSKLAFDGSGAALRGDAGMLPSYSLCRFPNGKVYNCDLNASYNIGARYLIRETLKSLPERARLDMLAKVPACSKRSTCTLSDFFNLRAAMGGKFRPELSPDRISEGKSPALSGGSARL